MQRSQDALSCSRSVRRRPLSSDADPSSPPPTPSPLSPAAQELEFPPRPPPNRGPISAPSNLASSENGSGGGSGGGDTTTAAAATAPGVTVKVNMSDSRSKSSSRGHLQDPTHPLFEPSGEDLDSGSGGLRGVDGYGGGAGGGGDVHCGGGGSGGGGATSLDDAWEIDGGVAGGGKAAGPLGGAVDAAAQRRHRYDGNDGDGIGSVNPAHLGEGAEAAAQRSAQMQLKGARPGDERAHKIWVTGGGDGNSVTGENALLL